jgi:hypothetical protein
MMIYRYAKPRIGAKTDSRPQMPTAVLPPESVRRAADLARGPGGHVAGTGDGCRWEKMCAHRILTDRLAEFGASSKLNAELPFLQTLKAEGRTTAEDFLKSRGSDLGLDRGYRRSSGGMLTMSPIDLIGLLGILFGLDDATHFEGAAPAGMGLGLPHRVAAIGCGAHGSLPHHVAVVPLRCVGGATSCRSYKDIFMVGIPGAMIVLLVFIALGSLVASF